MGDFGFYFRKGLFSTWFSSNAYHDTGHHNGSHSFYTYYNLLLRPILNLKHGWKISASVIYNSATKAESYKYGHVLYGTLRLSKAWKHVSAYVYGVQNFLGREHNILLPGTANESTVDTEYMHSYIGTGIRYIF